MQYEPLSKLFYKNPSSYEETYQKRFSDPESVHLDLSIKESPAFFLQTGEVYRLIISIQNYDKKIDNLCNLLPGVALDHFTWKCLVDEIVLTNDIEGVNSTRREINEVLEKLNTSHQKQRFSGLVRKYLMLQHGDKHNLVSCEDIRELYNELVLSEVVEENPEDAPDGKYFRKESVSVSNAAQKEIHRGLMPEENIISTMEKSLQFLNSNASDPLILISAFHYLFGYIHPFYNGNGRLSRFISSYLLAQELNYLISYRLSYTIKANIKTYYDAFKICNDSKNRGDLTPFVICFLEILQEAMEQLLNALDRRHSDLERFEILLDSHPLGQNPRYRDLVYHLIQAGLFSEMGISTKQLSRCLNLTYTPLKSRLNTLQTHNLLLVEKNGTEKFYKLNLDEFERQSQPKE